MRATLALTLLLAAVPLEARRDDVAGRVVFNGIGVPGAAVTLANADRTLTTATKDDGGFAFTSVTEGTWTLRVQMRGFVVESRAIAAPLVGAPLTIALTMQTFDEMAAEMSPVAATPELPPSSSEAAIINGSVVNGAATPFAQPRAFGSNRPQGRATYSGAFNVLGGNSALDASPYSFGSSGLPRPSYNDLHVGGVLAGPLKIPFLIAAGPHTTLLYQHARTHDATSQSAVVPTEAERRGDFSQSTTAPHDPFTGEPFAGQVIPATRISPSSASLLAYYPLPNTQTTTGANYQRPLLTATTEHRAQVTVQGRPSRRDSLVGTFSFQRIATDAINLLGFEDRTVRSTIDAGGTWTRRLGLRSSTRLHYRFARSSATTTPYFANRVDVADAAGILGTSRAPQDWGPPLVTLPDVADLRDGLFGRTVTTSHTAGAELLGSRGRHNLTAGGDVRWTHVAVDAQQDPRGSLSFTGFATGSAFADFLLGLPATASIAFGNADKRLRGMAYDAYINDDWRVRSSLTLNLGVRWEYESPFEEAGGRLTNLALPPDFSSATPVQAVLRRDWLGFQPRVGVSWRPIPASSLVIRGGYGIYRNTNVYQPLAMLMAQQPPFSKTYSIQSTAEERLTIATAFIRRPAATPNTFAVDPNVRVGFAENWDASMQRELPADLTVTVAYLGTRGRNLLQASLPNTDPPGATARCATCPSGFVYVSSGGRSLRHALQLTLRRRLRSGLTASVQYTRSTSTDDAATFAGGPVSSSALAIAQDWRDLSAERGPSSFDQPHLVTAAVEYTTGVGVAGGTLEDGWWGALYKDWTLTANLTAGSGLPTTPIVFVPVPGTGVTGIRPNVVGDGVYATPAPGEWGDAGRNSMRNPRQFSLDAGLMRTFRLGPRLNLDHRVEITNLLNHVTFVSIDRIISSPLFGSPNSASAMRRLKFSVRVRF